MMNANLRSLHYFLNKERKAELAITQYTCICCSPNRTISQIAIRCNVPNRNLVECPKSQLGISQIAILYNVLNRNLVQCSKLQLGISQITIWYNVPNCNLVQCPKSQLGISQIILNHYLNFEETLLYIDFVVHLTAKFNCNT